MQSSDSVATPHGTQDDDDENPTRPRLAQAAPEKGAPYPIKRCHENQVLELVRQHRVHMPAIVENPDDNDICPLRHSRNASSVPGRIQRHMAKSDMTSGVSDGVAFVEAAEGEAPSTATALCRGAHHSVPVRRHQRTSSSGCLGVLPVIRGESLERVAEEDDDDDKIAPTATVEVAVIEIPAEEIPAIDVAPATSSTSLPSSESRSIRLSVESIKDSSAPDCPPEKPTDTEAADATQQASSETDSSSTSSEWSAILEKVKALELVAPVVAGAPVAGGAPVVAGCSAPQQRFPATTERVERMASIGSCCCRICQSSNSPELLISPCRCKGSLAYVHLSCLERWLNQSGRTYCELCQFRFNAIQTPRYRLLQSMRLWYCHPRHRRQLFADLLIAVILTCVTLGLVSIIILGMRYFILEGAKLGISAQCTQFTITFFLAVVTSGYVVTMYLLVKDQIMPWLLWRRTNVNVRVLLDSEGQPRPRVSQQQPISRFKLNTLSRMWGHAHPK